MQRQILYIDHKEQNAADRVKYKAAALKGYIKKLLEKQKARDSNLFEIIQLSQQFTEVYQQINVLRQKILKKTKLRERILILQYEVEFGGRIDYVFD